MAKAANLSQAVKETLAGWREHHGTRLAAALAYYTLLSIAPLVVISVAIVGLVMGQEGARSQIAAQLGAAVGDQAAQGIQAIVKHARSPSAGIVSTVLGVLALLVGASGVFGELQSALDTIWSVAPKPGRGFLGVIRDRFFSFTMVLAVGFLLLVSLVLSAVLSAVGHVLSQKLPAGQAFWQVLNFLISFGIVTALFALIFKAVPDVDLRWRDVWGGAALTALLFALGKSLLGLYLGKTSLSSSYGAAGSVVVLVVWVYYAAQILFFGAEITKVQARHRGARIGPSSNAIPVDAAGHPAHTDPLHT